MKFRHVLTVAAIAAMPAVAGAQNLNYTGTVPNVGGGLGSVLTLLTLNNTSDFSSGCVRPFAIYAGCGYEDLTVHGSSQVRYLSELGLGSGTLGTDLRIIGNFSEPGSNQAIVNALQLSIYNQAGGLVQSWLLNSPQVIANTEPGVGNAGFGFSLDATGAAQFNTAVTNLLGLGNTMNNISIGLGAYLLDVQGGLDTFSVARVNATTVPEPSTYVLMAGGLFGLLGFSKRRKIKGA